MWLDVRAMGNGEHETAKQDVPLQRVRASAHPRLLITDPLQPSAAGRPFDSGLGRARGAARAPVHTDLQIPSLKSRGIAYRR